MASADESEHPAARALRWRDAGPALLALLAIVAVTNRWMSWSAGRRYQHAYDEDSYLAIARAVPHLPARALPDQHAQRWPLHWLVGALAQVTGLSVETTYRCAAIAIAFAICLVVAALLMRLRVSRATGLLCLAVLVLNPYAFRFYVFAPGYLADLAFELGLAVALLGLARRSLPLLVGGVLAGALARQTMLPVAPVLAAWAALDPRWRSRDGAAGFGPVLRDRAALLRALAVVGAALAAYVVVLRVAAGFSQPGAPLAHLTVVYALEHLRERASDLAVHATRTLIAVLPVAALLAATLWRSGVRGRSAAFWGALAVGVAIVAQTLVLSPDPYRDDYGSSNEPRLAALGLVPLVAALAAAREEGMRWGLVRIPPRAVGGALGALLLLGTLHHQYTRPSTGSTGATVALQLLVSLALFAVLAVSDRPALRRARLASERSR